MGGSGVGVRAAADGLPGDGQADFFARFFDELHQLFGAFVHHHRRFLRFDADFYTHAVHERFGGEAVKQGADFVVFAVVPEAQVKHRFGAVRYDVAGAAALDLADVQAGAVGVVVVFGEFDSPMRHFQHGGAAFFRVVTGVRGDAVVGDDEGGITFAAVHQRAVGARRFADEYAVGFFRFRQQPRVGVDGADFFVRVVQDTDGEFVAHRRVQFGQRGVDCDDAVFHVGDAGAVSAAAFDFERSRGGSAFGEDGVNVADEQYVVVVGILAIGNQQAGADFVVQVLPFDVPAAERGVFFGEHVGDFANAGGLVAAAVGIDEGFQVFQKGFFFHDFAPKR